MATDTYVIRLWAAGVVTDSQVWHAGVSYEHSLRELVTVGEGGVVFGWLARLTLPFDLGTELFGGGVAVR